MKSFIKIILLSLYITTTFASQLPLQKVTLQLIWKNQFEFAGYYMAKEKGFYKDVGLDVKFFEYKNGLDIEKNVATKKRDFGIGYSNIVLDMPKHQDIVILGTLLQSSPHVLISLKSSGIKSLKDFKHKKIMISESAKYSAAFTAMFHSKGISLTDMSIVKPTYNINSLLDKKVDLITAYTTNELYTLKKENKKYTIWNPKDYGFDLYNDLLFTSKKELSQHPKRVKNFLEASVKGWKYAFNHIDETINIILLKYNSQQKNRNQLWFEANALKKLSGFNTKYFFTVDKDKIQRIRDIYNIIGLVKPNADMGNMVYHIPLTTSLTKDEKEYLKKIKKITMCTDPNWMPYEKLKNGKHIGLVADYFKYFQKFIGNQTKIVIIPTKNWDQSLMYARQRKCDILSMLMKTPMRLKYLNFTIPYITDSIVMATRNSSPFTANFSTLKGQKIAIPKDYAFANILKIKYPNLRVVEVKDIDDGLKKVNKGILYGYVGNLKTIAYAIQKNYMNELKIAGKFDGIQNFHIGVRDDNMILLKIFNKAIRNLDEKTKINIANNWFFVKFEKGIDYKLIQKIIGIFLIILLIVMYFYMRLSKLKKKLEELSIKDPLTNLYNRRYGNKVSENIFLLSKRNSQKMSILMFDLDDFKDVNDTYGHKIGDEVLKSFANILQKLSRKSDTVCRYGGEEFIIFLPDTKTKGATILAQKIRKETQALIINNSVKITVSIGISELDLKDNSIENTIKRADDALYQAKANGKNQVKIYK